MIILHTGSLNEQLFLWCEKPANGNYSTPVRRARKQKTTKSKLYPYDGDFNDIVKVLQETSITIQPEKKHIKDLNIWLPTRESNPIPSSTLIAEPYESQAKIELKPWIITAYQLSNKDAVELLNASIGRKMLAPGVIIGTDLSWWAEVLRFTGSLIARQKYLPGVIQTGTDYLAKWEPVITGNDSEHMTRLANMMPPVARAFTESENASPPEIPSSEILKKFIAQSIDYLVRSSIGEDAKQKLEHRKKNPSFHSVHDAWLHALRTQNSIIEYNEKDCAQLREYVKEWRRPIDISASSPFRLCFRLEEPEETEVVPGKFMTDPDDPWHVRYLLQPYDDPSLLIPLEEVWKSREVKKSLVKHLGPRVREYILSSLGQASSICPRITASLKTSEPSGYEIFPNAVHDFLTEKAMILEQVGFSVMLPAWWTRKGTKTRLAIKAIVKSPEMQGGSGLAPIQFT